MINISKNEWLFWVIFFSFWFTWGCGGAIDDEGLPFTGSKAGNLDDDGETAPIVKSIKDFEKMPENLCDGLGGCFFLGGQLVEFSDGSIYLSARFQLSERFKMENTPTPDVVHANLSLVSINNYLPHNEGFYSFLLTKAWPGGSYAFVVFDHGDVNLVLGPNDSDSVDGSEEIIATFKPLD